MITTEVFLIAMAIIFTVPYLIWRLGRTDCYAPLVLVQIFTGSCLDRAFSAKRFPTITPMCLAAGRAIVERHRVMGGDAICLDFRHCADSEENVGLLA